jgi:cytochrome c2
MNFNQIINQITKVFLAFIFTLIVIGSLSSVSNSIFIDKIFEDLNSISINKINQVKLNLIKVKKSLEINKKRVSHTVVGRKELIEEIEGQESIIDSLAFISSPDRAKEHLKEINDNLKNTEYALSHSIIGRESLINKINQQKSDIAAFKKIMPMASTADTITDVKNELLSEQNDQIVEEKKVIVEPPKLTFEEELAFASVDAGAKLSRKCTACHSLNSAGGNRVGPTLWNIVNAPKAKIEGFSYSASLSSLGGNWTIQDLNLWLKSPKKYAPGNAMSFAGLRKIKDRANMVAFLNSISDEPLENNGLN